MPVVPDSTRGLEHRASLCTIQLVHGWPGRLKQPSHMAVGDGAAPALAATLICRALAAPASGKSSTRGTPAEARGRSAKEPYAEV